MNIKPWQLALAGLACIAALLAVVPYVLANFDVGLKMHHGKPRLTVRNVRTLSFNHLNE